VALLGGMALLEKMCHCVGLRETFLLDAWKPVFSYLPLEQDVEFSVPLALGLSEFCHGDNGPSL